MKVIIKGASITVENRCALAVGNDNSLRADFEFSSEWDSLTKYAAFANGDTVISVPLSTDTCPIPWEVLACAGELYVALRGVADGGTVVYCTQNAFLGPVPSSIAAALAEESREHTPDILDALEARLSVVENGGTGSDTPPEVSNAIATGGIGWTDGGTITWDGDTTGRDAIIVDGSFYLYKVADAIIAMDEFIQMSGFDDSGNPIVLTAQDLAGIATESDSIFFAAYVISGAVGNYNVTTPDDEQYSFTVPSTGTYFAHDATSPMRITAVEYGTQTVHKIDEKYLPGIPTQLSQLTGDTTHRTVTDAEKTAWNGKVAISQGVAHAGKFLVVGDDGNVTTMTLETWEGGSYGS